MQSRYGEFDGQPFPTPDSLFPQPKVVHFILQYGQKALDAMEQLDDDAEKQYIQQMIDAGLLERDPATGALRLTPKMVRGIEHKSLLEVFEGLQRGTREGHATIAAGHSDERSDGTRPYQYGDPISNLDLGATMRHALAHQVTDSAPGTAPTDQRKNALPIRLHADDLELHVTEGQADTALCILLDMSGSMMRNARFFQAKRVALGMAALVRARFPQDTLDYAGFYSTACTIREGDLPLVMPKPISTYDGQVRVRIPLEQAERKSSRVPQHFTNLQLGLRLARQMLARRAAANKQLFIITDGQPTAHVEAAGTNGNGSASEGLGEMLYLIYPPSERTRTATLKEALRCHQQGIRIATFALVEDYWGMEWVGFVDQLTRLTRGLAFYCSSEDLSSTVIESYLSGKRRKSVVV
jgi:Ca-activated chloride channel homolog